MADLSKLADPGSPEELLVRRIDMERLPRHVAIIMDGNGRWAKGRSLPRVEGHRAGVASVREAVETAARLGLPGPHPLRLLGGELEAPALRGVDADEPAQGVRPQGAAGAGRQRHPLQRARPLAGARSLGGARAGGDPGGDRPLPRHELQHRPQLLGARRDRGRLPRHRRRLGRRPAGRHRRGDDRPLPLHLRPARPRPDDPHLRRAAGLQLPALADRLRRDLGHPDPLARLPPPRPLRGDPRLPAPRAPVRRRHAARRRRTSSPPAGGGADGSLPT